jgi:hypothetical protein
LADLLYVQPAACGGNMQQHQTTQHQHQILLVQVRHLRSCYGDGQECLAADPSSMALQPSQSSSTAFASEAAVAVKLTAVQQHGSSSAAQQCHTCGPERQYTLPGRPWLVDICRCQARRVRWGHVRHVQQRSVWVVRQQCQLLLWQVEQLQQAALAGIRKHLPAAAAVTAQLLQEMPRKQHAYATTYVLSADDG